MQYLTAHGQIMSTTPADASVHRPGRTGTRARRQFYCSRFGLLCYFRRALNRLRGSLYAVFGVAALVVALLVPAYLRSLDVSVVTRAGLGTGGPLSEATQQARLDKIGLAEILAQAAVAAEVPDAKLTLQAVQQQRAARPAAAVWGGTDSLLQQVCGPTGARLANAESVMDLVLPEPQRLAVLRFLGTLRRLDVQEALKNRALQKTALFPPVASSSGQALDAAILLTGLLMQADALRPSLRAEIEQLAGAANRGYDTAPIEIVYLNVTSLAKRMTWDQLVSFLQRVKDLAQLRELTRAVTLAPADLPVIFAALYLAESPDAVAEYLRTMPKTGIRDVRFALGAGKGGLALLLARQQPLYYAPWRDWMLAVPGVRLLFRPLVALAQQSWLLALILKYLLWLDGAFCLARAYSNLRREPSPLAMPLQVRGVNTLRQQAAAALALALAVALMEPGLARDQTPLQPATLWSLPRKNPSPTAQVTTSLVVMNNQTNWLALAVFFAVQLTVYIVGLIKLREIRRQEIPSALKLKILDNEENLFDTGLYVGLGGTGLSLVLMALNLFTASPMIAYASTGFGVFFASLLKIIHVRAYRRELILQAEWEASQVTP